MKASTSIIAALALVIAACSTEPEPELEPIAEAMDESALSSDDVVPGETIPEAAETPPQADTMQSGSNDGTERRPGPNSKLQPADPD